ncbi:MAG: tRNA (N(6)-L-threonylcarbamoyladenosine(37)-C(2))-methylthiotransferase MtaB [Planctomycetia bacterium]|nr:tRNA (N(6)-L-threonylcarbamoyladenosine(37)-C(2))-methylthiotransferase MtaB [Planctomycetia bacterium]
MPKLRTATLGCKVNQYETQYVRESLEAIGYREAVGDERADLCIVNTCTVTAEGDAKSRQLIRRLARTNPHARIVVMGCYATRAPDEVAALPGVAEIITDKRELPDLLGRFGVVDVPTGISGLVGRQRAYVKVQDGCTLNCTFCIIPKVRPVLASRPPEQILAEIARLAARGYREIILTGIHLGHYGVEWNRGRPKREWVRLSHLLERVTRLDGNFRVRLSSIEATEVTRELVAVMAANPRRVCPHLHISMQSGSDRVLRRMRRRWGAKRFVDRCRLVQGALDRPALSTDIIVGFPGETDGDFADTCRVAEEVAFSKIHVFPFSPRRTTPAAEMLDQVPAPVKNARAEELAALAARLSDRYYRSLLGRPLQVLIEARAGRQQSTVMGTSCRYAPVELPAAGTKLGQFVEVIAGAVADGRIVAAG